MGEGITISGGNTEDVVHPGPPGGLGDDFPGVSAGDPNGGIRIFGPNTGNVAQGDGATIVNGEVVGGKRWTKPEADSPAPSARSGGGSSTGSGTGAGSRGAGSSSTEGGSGRGTLLPGGRSRWSDAGPSDTGSYGGAEFEDLASVKRFAQQVAALSEGSDFVQIIKACGGLEEMVRDFGGHMNIVVREFVEAAISVHQAGEALRDQAAQVASLATDLSGD